jgi:hypothetical protein
LPDLFFQPGLALGRFLTGRQALACRPGIGFPELDLAAREGVEMCGR